MPLDGEGLAAARKAAVEGVPPSDGSPAGAAAYADAVRKADSGAIVDYIKDNAVVNVASVGAVTPGPGVSGPGLGTIS